MTENDSEVIENLLLQWINNIKTTNSLTNKSKCFQILGGIQTRHKQDWKIQLDTKQNDTTTSYGKDQN